MGESEPHAGCHVQRFEKPVAEDMLNRSSAAILEVFGMGCPHCATRVRNGLLRLAGVGRVVVSLEKRRAWVDFDPEVTVPEQLVDAVVRAGVESRHEYNAVVVNLFA